MLAGFGSTAGVLKKLASESQVSSPFYFLVLHALTKKF